MQTASTIDTHKDNPSATENVALPNAISEGTAIQMIPLKRLVASPYNQRQKPRLEATVEAFAVNIAAVGLMQNLVVHPMKVGAKKAQTYGVTAGETRRLALLRNVEKGIIDADFEVPCCIVTEGDAILASASENDLRVPPHPADQFAAYKALADQGRSPEFIGAIFNVSAKTVARHLRLANVSPQLFDMVRADEIELGQMHALAITDDHAAQEQAWFGAKQSWDRAANKLKQVLLAAAAVTRSAA
jgi:ParB family chromosome partitioning protein